MKKRKILFYLFHFNKGGAEWVITNLANSMSKNNIEVTIWSVKEGNMFDEVNDTVIQKHFSGKYLISLFYLIKVLMLNKYDVILTTQRFVAIFVFIAIKISFTKTKHIVREAASNFQSTFDKRDKLKNFILKYFFRVSYGNAYKIIVNSPGTKLSLEEAGIIKSEKNNVYQIDNPLDISKIQERAKEKQKIDFNVNKYRIISIGRLVSFKNTDIIIRAFKQVLKLVADCQLIIVGAGPEKNNLIELSKDLELHESIIFTGQLDNPYSLLKYSDVLVHASQWEGFGQVIIEALALGIPVIATNIVGGPQHILNYGEFGTLVKPGSITALVSAIVDNKTKVHNVEKLKKRAQCFDINIVCKKYEKVIFDF